MQSQNCTHRRRCHHQQQPTSNHHRKCLGRDFRPRLTNEPFERKHVVIVMNALKEFSVETLIWVLKNIELDTCCTITLLGVKPWLSFVFSCKTETDIWTTNIENLLSMRGTDDWKTDIRCQKAEELVNLCLKYKVKPRIEIKQGFPEQLLVLERIASACATWVVFDRHHNKKHVEYVAKKFPCNILAMNNNGEVDMIKCRSTTTFERNYDSQHCSTSLQSNDESNDESQTTFTTSNIPTPKLILSDEYKRKLKITSP